MVVKYTNRKKREARCTECGKKFKRKRTTSINAACPYCRNK